MSPVARLVRMLVKVLTEFSSCGASQNLLVTGFPEFLFMPLARSENGKPGDTIA